MLTMALCGRNHQRVNTLITVNPNMIRMSDFEIWSIVVRSILNKF